MNNIADDVPAVKRSRLGGHLVVRYGTGTWVMSFSQAAALARAIDQELHDDFLTTGSPCHEGEEG